MSRSAARAAAVAVLALLTLACGGLDADVSGSRLTIDDQPWEVTGCESGEVHGFAGIELTGADGRRLRLQTRPDGRADVFVMPPGASVGEDLGTCATASFERTSLTVNNVKAVRGGGTIACDGGAHTIDGQVAVDRCATALF